MPGEAYPRQTAEPLPGQTDETYETPYPQRHLHSGICIFLQYAWIETAIRPGRPRYTLLQYRKLPDRNIIHALLAEN